MRMTFIRTEPCCWRDWRGGWVESYGDPASVRVAEGAHQVVLACALSLLPGDARSTHCPIAVRVSGDNPGEWTVTTIVGSSFHSADALVAQAGRFRPALIPQSITNENRLNWTASAPRHSSTPAGKARDGEMPSDEPWSF